MLYGVRSIVGGEQTRASPAASICWHAAAVADDTGTDHLMACKVWLGFTCSRYWGRLPAGCISVRSPAKAPASLTLTRNQSQKALPHTTPDPPATHTGQCRGQPLAPASPLAYISLHARPVHSARLWFTLFFFFGFHFGTDLFSPLAARFHVVSRSELQLTGRFSFFSCYLVRCR